MPPPWRRRLDGRRGCGRESSGWRGPPPPHLHRMIFIRFAIAIFVIMAIVGAIVGRTTLVEHKWLGICIGAVVLWITAGFISHKLVRPLSRVAQVARDIGTGELGSRVDLAHAPGEIGELATAINEMAERIERQLEDQRALLAAVSHEIRTPLGHMRVIAELARAGDTGKLAELEREIMEVDTLVDQILASSRLDFSTLARRPLDATDVCLRALERADLDSDLLEVDADDTAINGDPMLLTRAVGNLIENARRHGDSLEAIAISNGDGALRIAVRDRGPGFTDEALATAFERFRGGGKGSLGLGLALVKRIAEAHGGTARAANIDGGAEVVIELETS